MNFDPTPEQSMLIDAFTRLFAEESSIERVRASLPTGFDPELWQALAAADLFRLRATEPDGGSGLGLIEAVMVMELAGRHLASGPVGEAIVLCEMLSRIGAAETTAFSEIADGERVAALASSDVADQPAQWVPFGACADLVIARRGDDVVALTSFESGEPDTLGSVPTAEIDFGSATCEVLAQGEDAVSAFLAAIEERKLFTAAALCGLARRAIELAVDYARDRTQFGQPIGTFQAISHPLADLSVAVDGAKYAVWEAIRSTGSGEDDAAAKVSLALWLASDASGKAVSQALHTFGGYGLTVEYDIHLFDLRAKAWALGAGDPQKLLYEAGRRLYAEERPPLPDAGTDEVDFSYGDEAEALAEETRAFFAENLTPDLRAKAHYSHEGHDPGFHRKIADAGLLFPDWPRELGGREASPYAAKASQEVWDENDWTTYVQGTCNMVGTVMRLFGTDELKAGPLAEVARGTATCALGFSEPASGSDVFAAQTRARPDGNDWRIDGQKMFTSGAENADYVLLLARTDPEAAKHRGLTMFIVPLDAKGIEIQPVQTMQDEPTNITYYDGVHIDDSYRLGEVGSGVQAIGAAFKIEHGVSFVRYHRKMLTSAEAVCRETGTESGTMIEDPAVQYRLARVAAHVLASTVLGYRSLWSTAEGKPDQAFGSSVKMYSSERYRTDAADLIDLLAPVSLSKSGPAAYVNQCYRHAQVAITYAGTTEVHRSVIAERQLGLPRSRG